ncbi:hypothetical protein [Amycolatopsis japonica]|uniref:hypothetical protein n=1 Tax=Amycolatopsis japonica TaxID=208439 RepID=UPI0033F51168
MTEEECAVLLNELEQILEDKNLGFIVAQERVIAAEGTSETSEDIATREQESDDFTEAPISQGGLEYRLPSSPLTGERLVRRPSVRKGNLKAGDVVVKPLGIRSRLALLLDLVEVATAGTVAMEQVVVDELGTESPAGFVMFDSPPEAELRGQSLASWTLLDRGDSESHVSPLIDTVDRLRVAAGVPRGQWLAAHGRSDDSRAWEGGS